MLDVLGMVATLGRPRLLVQAARLGLEGYRRAAHLPRLIGAPLPDRPGETILRLIEAESEAEERRLARAGYSAARHVAILAALLGESRLLRESLRPRLVA